MADATHSETVLADLAEIQNRFTRQTGRIVKADLLEKFINDETLSQDARLLASEAADELYKTVVWDDDVRGYYMVDALEVVKIRYRRAQA